MLHLGDLKKDASAAPARSRARGAAPVPDWPARFAELAAAARDPRLRAFYAAGAVAGDTPRKDVPMVAIDVETTGLDPARDEIVSIGVVPMDAACIRSSASRYWVVRPRAELHPESVTIHAITHAQIEAAPDFGAIIDELLPALAGQVVVVHCREIERAFLDLALKARIGEGLEFPVIDTMELEARLHRPAPFSGDLDVTARLVGGPVRNLNLIYNAKVIEPAVEVILGPATLNCEAGTTGLLCLSGAITVAGDGLREGAFALGNGADIELAAGAAGIRITLRKLA